MSQLQKLPVLIIAVVAEGSGDSHVTAEGQQLAEQNGAYFLATSSPEWGSECLDVHVYMAATPRVHSLSLPPSLPSCPLPSCPLSPSLPPPSLPLSVPPSFSPSLPPSPVGCTSHFFSKCWYSRFTSWQIQNYNPRGNKDRFVCNLHLLTYPFQFHPLFGHPWD